MSANNVTRFLDSRNVDYTAHEFPRKKMSALEVAQILGVSTSLVYKTIVVERRGKGKPILAVIPGHREVDVKALAKAAGEKKVKVTTQQRAEKYTKLQAGGISPLALINKGFDVFLDVLAKEHEKIYLSGGERGINIYLPVEDLRMLTGANLAAISREG